MCPAAAAGRIGTLFPRHRLASVVARWSLRTIQDAPFNASTPLAALDRDVTPNDLFYVRNHFAVPDVDPATWRLDVGGAVAQDLSLSVDDLRDLPQRTVIVTLECAGNGRRSMEPAPPGTPWDDGAVSTAAWTGPPLSAVLDRAGVADDAVEVLCTGMDRGKAGGAERPFERSLPLERALDPDVVLAHAMNGEPLPPDHGAPLRVVVPGAYGMASVKWLDRLELLTEPFDGWFQTERYVYRDADGRVEGPVDRVLVKSLIARPADGAEVVAGTVEVAGRAWGGQGAGVERVEVRVDDGPWTEADLADPVGPHAWRRFLAEVDVPPGDRVLASRATDAEGNVQPLDAPWNAHGYGNNAVAPVRVHAA